jgi:hypothetical protein
MFSFPNVSAHCPFNSSALFVSFTFFAFGAFLFLTVRSSLAGQNLYPHLPALPSPPNPFTSQILLCGISPNCDKDPNLSSQDSFLFKNNSSHLDFFGGLNRQHSI